MKKLVSILLVVSMVVTMCAAWTSAAVGTGLCYNLNADAIYGYFNNFTMNATDSVIAFDIAMAADNDGAPVLTMNSSNEIVIRSNSVTLANQTAPITWGALETKHWRHFEIRYLNGAATISINGEVVLSVASGATCRTNGITFLGWPGTILIDNLKVSNNAGTVLQFIDFDDEGVYLNAKSSDSTAIRTSVPAGSYTDPMVVNDYPVIFDNANNASLLASAEYSSSQKAAKLTYSGANGGAANAFLDFSSANLSADDYKYAVVTYMTPNATDDKNSDVAVSAAVVGAVGSTTPSESLKSSFTLNTDGRYHSQVINLSALNGWTGDIGGLQLRFFEAANNGDVMYVDSIVLCGTLSKASAVATARENAKSNYGIFDSNGLGYYDGSNYVCNFDSSDAAQYITDSKNTNFAYDATNNALKCTVTGSSDPSVYVDLTEEGISADTFKYVVYTYRIPTATKATPTGNFYYVCGNITVPTGGHESNVYTYAKDGDLHYAVIDLSAKSNWSGNIKGLRIDYFEAATVGDVVYIDSIIFCTTAAAANDAGAKKLIGTPGNGLGHLEGTNYVCNFDSSDSLQYVSNGNNTSFTYDSNFNALKCTMTGTSDPSVYVNLTNEDISANVFKYIVYTYRIPTTTRATPSGNFYYVNGPITVPTGGYETSVNTYTKDGDLHYAVIDLSAKSNWTGNIKGLRIDYFMDGFVGDVVYIDSIIFCTSLANATAAGNSKVSTVDPGTGFGELDGENYVCNFDSNSAVQYVSNGANTSFNYDSANNALKLTATGTADPSVYVNLLNEEISANDYKYIVYTYRIPTSTQAPTRGNFYYVNGPIEGPTPGYETPVYNYTKDGQLHYQIIDLSAQSNWTGDIKGLRIDYLTNAVVGDVVYIDSLIFCKTELAAIDAGRDKTQGPLDPTDAAAVWNYFWKNGTVSGDEYIVQSGTNIYLYFKYNSSRALTQTSLANRLEKAIKRVTGVDLEVQVYTGFIDIKDNFKSLSEGQSASKNMQFTLIPEGGPAYCVWVNTTISLVSSASSDLNGDDTVELDPVYPDLNQESIAGVEVTDSVASFTTSNGMAVHSNHETRVLHTADKTFAVYPTGSLGEWNAPNSAQFEIFQVNADGSVTSFYTGSMRNSSSKPNIMLGYDGMVYVFFATDANGVAQLDAYYFNPNSSTYNVTKVSATKSYNGGPAAGGYGYTQPVLDNAQRKVHMIFCGGQNGTGDFAWFTFNQQSKSWESNAQHISIGHRHAYVYAYANGNGGVNIVAERDILLSELGLAGIVTGADYAWDELSLFHIPDMYASNYTKSTFAPADYTQQGRQLFPIVQNNSWGDTYLSSDGKLHILYQKLMHGTNHHDTRYREIWHAVYDTTVSGTPELLYNMPIKFVNEENYYACRFAESTSGDLYILATPANRNARVEIWTSADANDFTFSFDSAYSFSNTSPTVLSLIVSGPRNGSVQNNVIDCMYPTSNGSGSNTYRTFRVRLP